ncbi:MAG: acetyl-CoA hydrolase/transferase C-terminal domain-containing protein [Desulfobacterales bacterium]|jgi:acyl-CoA hydrolase|nr:acetyl-CoA hydrolase/transferase C-terminal domain-containing protein [Desulfobacterales bacterium]MDD3082309.1 acetyl-CoA hydrolase/transferase C-terminal domain-containing protein [Desulfobacterales bacterium]MDD3950984.1 acetyl-CoA hydrolase/transferase C-terminal domain-containing protein [Desulfobacterales bacterium]MDD4462977.1 acetyl-CoA hydrolase/transferase C-terminal domain-containing protein [Desulfobacterales bacterium]MDY0378357.1 acetyl-CoA hydrolase/transferase C-terminal doma
MRLDPNWKSKAVSAEDAAAHIKNGMRVFIHGAAATPTPLIASLCKRPDLENVTLYHLHLLGDIPFASASQQGRFFSVSLFTGADLRKPIEEGRADFMPIFLGDIPRLFASGTIRLDAAIVQLSPPDRHGFCTLGTSVDAARSAADSARMVIAEINDQMPRTYGNTAVRFDRITAFIHTDRPLIEHPTSPETSVEARMGELIADIIEDGATLQIGIGNIPDAVLSRLHDKHDLGVHTEMFSDRVVDLVEAGVITNRLKKVHPNRITTSFVNGSRRLFDFVDDNPTVEFHPCDRTNDTALIRQNDKFVAINAALEIDLTGQVCADSLGHRIYSGIGGQMDFIHGAALSKGGKPVIAIPATAARGTVSRIVPELKPGAGVVTTRGHVHWVVTEFGAVNLNGKTLRERGEALISIAHPDFRSELRNSFARIRHFVLG